MFFLYPPILILCTGGYRFFIAPVPDCCKRNLGTDWKDIVTENMQEQAVGLYAISVVSQLVGTGQQNIRLYERKGLLTPDRTAGGTRQYSDADLAVLRRISELLDEGLNLAGVAKVLELEAANARLRAALDRAGPKQPRGRA